jgi:N-acetylmuramoyl-L-alanine amidase
MVILKFKSLSVILQIKVFLLALTTCLSAASYSGCHDTASNPVIAIDVGHSPNNPGATSASGIGEFIFNKKIATLLHKVLNEEEFADSFLLGDGTFDLKLKERAIIAQQQGADLLLSIHHDSVQPHYLKSYEKDKRKYRYSDKFSGFSLFFSEDNGDSQTSKSLAESIGQSLIESGIKPSHHHAEPIPGENRDLVDPLRGIYRFDELVILRTARIPAVLIECGIIVNRAEEKRLQTTGFQRQLVDAIVVGLKRFMARKSAF